VTRGAAALAVAVLLAATACDDGSERAATAPIRPRAVLILEPPALGLGEVGWLELAVVTPPGHRVRPYRPPESIPGLWLLDAEPPVLERRTTRWIQRTGLRVRAREVGHFAWPEGRVEVEDAQGRTTSLAVPPVEFEVVSALPAHPERSTPFGVRAPAGGDSVSPWWAGGAGAALALALVGWIALARRVRRAPARPIPEASEPPWTRARREIEVARGALGRDPLEAADRGAVALRRYVAGRFGADAIARTTEELAAATPPFGARSRWPRFVSLLSDLDALRFVPSSDVRQATRRARALLAEVDAWVEETRVRDDGS
jgi:hypothetical protein